MWVVLTCVLPVSAIGSTPEPMRRRRDLAHLSDEALVALIARSDESALAELYDRIGGTAYGLAYRVLRDEALAEDASEGFDLDPDACAPARGRSRAAGAAAARGTARGSARAE